jgi:hypothetical protein
MTGEIECVNKPLENQQNMSNCGYPQIATFTLVSCLGCHCNFQSRVPRSKLGRRTGSKLCTHLRLGLYKFVHTSTWWYVGLWVLPWLVPVKYPEYYRRGNGHEPGQKVPTLRWRLGLELLRDRQFPILRERIRPEAFRTASKVPFRV